MNLLDRLLNHDRATTAQLLKLAHIARNAEAWTAIMRGDGVPEGDALSCEQGPCA